MPKAESYITVKLTYEKCASPKCVLEHFIVMHDGSSLLV